MNIIKEIKSLNLPFGKYAVFGSGPLHIHGIRETTDVDIVVLPEIYNQLKRSGWVEKSWESGPPGRYLQLGNIEIVDNWKYGEYNPDPLEIISNAEIIHGIPFVRLEEVLKWKRVFGREKDKKDIKLIEEFLKR